VYGKLFLNYFLDLKIMDGGNCGRDPTNQPPIGFALQVPRTVRSNLLINKTI
jgi:hypothetical protein